MSNNKRLISKITAPVSSDLLHRSDHAEWSTIVDASLRAMWHLVVAVPGGEAAGTNTVSAEISRNKKAIATLETIVDCPECAKVEERHTLAVKILAHTAKESSSRGDFIDRLLSIFADEGRSNEFRALAGQSLAALSYDKEIAKIILHAENYVARVFNVLDKYGHKENRALAARILEGLCSHYSNSKDDASSSFDKLKDAATHIMPLVNKACRIIIIIFSILISTTVYVDI